MLNSIFTMAVHAFTIYIFKFSACNCAGQKIDLDGVIVKGNAEVDMAALTGESVPVSMMPGSEVLSGSVNLDGMLIIKATKPYSESTVSRILAMIEDSNGKKSNAEKFISRFARIYTPIVCLIALLIIVVPPLFFHGEWSEWIYRGLSALVVSCPCAIVISIPLGFFSGLGACSKQGILIKGSNYLEMLSKCNVGVFDKTGTITSGKFESPVNAAISTSALPLTITPSKSIF